MNNQYSIPGWVDKVISVLGINLSYAQPLLGGVVADVWCVEDANRGKTVIRRTKTLLYDTINIVETLNIALNCHFLPNNFGAYKSSEYFISYYSWYAGAAMQDFDGCLDHILNHLYEIHNYFCNRRLPSIYAKVFDEAIYIKENTVFSPLLCANDKKSILIACDNVLTFLSPRDLQLILDCRGWLTHGDPKPTNVIYNNNCYQMIDWDKLCTMSPEADIAYAIFTGCTLSGLSNTNINKYINNCSALRIEILKLAFDYLPHMYLIHDAFICLTTNTRHSYIHDNVMPLWISWNERKAKLVFLEATK